MSSVDNLKLKLKIFIALFKLVKLNLVICFDCE